MKSCLAIVSRPIARQIGLEKLSTGLAKELEDYFAEVRDAKSAIDRAREALAKAFERPKGKSARETR